MEEDGFHGHERGFKRQPQGRDEAGKKKKVIIMISWSDTPLPFHLLPLTASLYLSSRVKGINILLFMEVSDPLQSQLTVLRELGSQGLRVTIFTKFFGNLKFSGFTKTTSFIFR